MHIEKISDYESLCRQRLPIDTFDYYYSGADDEITLKWNTEAFSKIKLLPRVLKQLPSISMETNILGFKVDLPFGIAPFAMQKLIHQNGEKVTALEAANRNVAFCLSLLSTTKTQEIAQVNPKGMKIQQFYFLKSADYTKKLLELAEKRGFCAVAITVDTSAFGKRRRDHRNKFQPEVTLQIFQELGIDIKFDSEIEAQSFVHNISNSLSWDDILWIKRNTSLKVILKGITHPEDVALAEQVGVDAIWISNHGGRQLDTSPATIVTLMGIRQKIKDLRSKMQIFIDGGINSGSDIFKCLALGADYVFLGRGFLYSLIDGYEGISNCFDILIKQLKRTMAMCGVSSVVSIDSSYIFQLRAKL